MERKRICSTKFAMASAPLAKSLHRSRPEAYLWEDLDEKPVSVVLVSSHLGRGPGTDGFWRVAAGATNAATNPATHARIAATAATATTGASTGPVGTADAQPGTDALDADAVK